MKVTFDEYKAILEDKIKRAKDMKPVMKKIAGDMETKVDFRFRQGKDPNGSKWEPLSEATLKNRKKNGKDAKPLRDSGALALSIHSKITKDSAVTGSDRPYAAYQQFPAAKGEVKKNEEMIVKSHTRKSHTRRTRKGTCKVKTHTVKTHERENKGAPWGDKPGRPFLGFSERQKAQYKRWVKEYIQKGGLNE